jgi:hypothetical protein
MYVGYSVESVYIHGLYVIQGTYKSQKFECMGSYNMTKFLGFAGVVCSFQYFLVGHFPSKGALVSFDIILMIR